ncbi:unnamed protein product [Rhizophagus irregularis]|nr:unnamed protein product [Rhizophagus irregularis]
MPFFINIECKLLYLLLYGKYGRRVKRRHSKLEFTHDDCSNISNETILSYENNHILLYSGRKDEISDKGNVDSLTLILRNLKKKCGKGRPLSTKRFKSSTEATKPSQEIIDIAENVGRLATIKKNCKVHN